MSEENGSIDSEIADESVDESQLTPVEIPAVAEQALAEMLQEFELKVNGKTVKESINLNDKARIQKALQMEKAAQEAFQGKASSDKQLKEYEATVDQFFKKLQENPMEILSNPDLNISREQRRQLAEMILNDELDLEAKSPEQIELESAKKELLKLQEEKKSSEKAKQDAEFSRLQNEAAIQIEKEIMEAIDVGELPKSNYITQKMADLAYIAFTNGIDIDMKELVPMVKKQYIDDMRDMLAKLPDDLVEDLISRDRVKKIRTNYLSTMKKQQLNSVKVADVGSKKVEEKPVAKQKTSDFFKGAW
jgi:hypothetical protein